MLPAMANSSVTTDKGLENAIKYVKSKIDIPEDCKKFSYYVYNQNGQVIWNLSWSNDELQKNIYVTIDQDNFISSYSAYYPINTDKKIPKYSRAQGKEIAENFIEKLNPNLLKEFKSIDNSNVSSEREYYFNYVRQVNGIDYANNTLSINVNNYTGQVTNFYCNYSKNAKFEPADNIISLDQAKKNFIDKLGLKLVYNIKTNKDKAETYLAYVPKDSSKYIDAITGEVEKLSSSYEYYYSTEFAAKTTDTNVFGAAVVLTPEEMKAVTDLSGLKTKEELDKKFRSMSIFNIDSQFNLESAELRKDWRDEETLTWYLRYTKVVDKEKNQIRDIQITADARNGDVLSFWTYYDASSDAKPQRTKEEARKICDEILSKLIPNYYSEVKYDDTYDFNNENKEFNFRYVRVKNGLECPGNYVQISFDNLSGNIYNFSFNWTKKLEFDDPAKAMPIEKAYEVLFDNNKLGYSIQYISDYNYLRYISQEKKVEEAVLGYMINGNKPCIISAETGELLNYSGAPYKDNLSDYTDIKGSKYENQVKILTQLSIRYYEDELKANEYLQQQDYFILLCKLNDIYYLDSGLDKETSVERMYSNLISSGIITKSEKAPTSVLTKEEAAKYFVKFQRMGQVAEIKGIFKSDFKDADKINPNLLGYVCIASGLKAVNSDNGYFKPKDKMTRLDGLLTIYNYLSNK